MKQFTQFSLRNPVAIVLLVLLIAIGGVYSAGKFKQEQLPDVSFPGIFVTAVYPGAAPNEVLSQVTMPLEKTLRNVEGVKNIVSQSANSVSFLQLEFSYSDDMREKKSKVEEALGGIQLPEDVEKPEVAYYSTSSEPVMYTSVFAKEGDDSEELVRFVKDSVIPELQGIEGVAEVQTFGLQDDGVYIRLNAPRMTALGVTYEEVQMALQTNNLSVPLGEVTMKNSNLPVFVQGDIRTIDDLKKLVVSPVNRVTLGDIAQIEQGKEASVISMTNGEPSINLHIVKTGTANTVEVSDQVQKVFDNAKEQSNIDFLIMYDRASDVKESINTLVREGGLGALFASILILFFLRNFRATLIAIVSIPLSVMIAIICLKYFTDVTLNIMTLGGLAVATGRVVDDSIVVIENIVRRLQKEKATKEMILDGTIEVGKAITSSTLTTIAVFAPLGLLQGLSGEFFRPFALTVTFALLASLLVAYTVVPLTAWWLMKHHRPKEQSESALSRGYKRVLRWSLQHKFAVLSVAALLFLGSLAPIFTGAIGVTFLPETDYKYAFASMSMPKGTSLNAVKQEAERIDAIIREHAAVSNSQVTVGDTSGQGVAVNHADWFIGLSPDADIDEFIEEMNDKVNVPEGTQFNLFKDGEGGGGRISITVTGPSMDDIRKAADLMIEAIEGMEGTENVSSNLQDGTKGISIAVRQQDASEQGLSVAQASGMLRPFLTETRIGRLGDGTSANDLYLALSGESLASAEDIANLKLRTRQGTEIAVKDIADVSEVDLPSNLQLKNGAEYATVTAKITDKNVSKVNAELVEKLEALELPDGVTYTLGGSNEEIDQMLSDMAIAMLVAIGMVYIVMVVTFREGRAPLAVLFSLPFALIGGLAGTLIAQEPISISSLIGFLMLIGIVVTNAIVLVERVQQQIERGLTIREALIEAGGTRLRPILMTAIATICALMPLAAGLGGGSIISSGLAVVVIGGLASSTLLTLVVVPVMYELLYFKRSRKQRQSVAVEASSVA